MIAVNNGDSKQQIQSYIKKGGFTFTIAMNNVGSKVRAGDKFGVIESVKAVSDLYAPLDGEIAAVNDAVVKDPSLVAAEPYGKGWLIKIKAAPGARLDKLLHRNSTNNRSPPRGTRSAKT